MKKFLAMICTLMILTTFASCGDTPQNSSEPSSSISESEEKITEFFPLITDEINLDSSWECDYLKIATCSEWKEESKIDDDEFIAKWSDKDFKYSINILLGKSTVGKMSQEDLQICYIDLEYDDYKIIDSFEKNGQAYIIMGDSKIRDFRFSTDTVDGIIGCSVDEEEIVMDMIDSIEFY